jgi:hypothetical protein
VKLKVSGGFHDVGIYSLKLISSVYLQGKEGNGKMHSRD